jgi:hypothetical protein
LKGTTTKSNTPWGDADDSVKATNLALLATDRAEALLNEMIGEARKLIAHHWPDIEALAQQLLVKKRVNFLESGAGAPEKTGSSAFDGVTPEAMPYIQRNYLRPKAGRLMRGLAIRPSR